MSNRQISEHTPPAKNSSDSVLSTFVVSVLRQRVFFWLGIGFWMLIFSIPFFFVMLAMMGEISFNLPSDYPESRVRVWMVMEIRERGIAYSLPQVVARDGDVTLTVQTEVRYMLWEGQSEVLHYCNQYVRNGQTWAVASQYEGRCARGGDGA